MTRADSTSWTRGNATAIELPDPELIAFGVPVRVGDDLVLVGLDGSRHVVTGYFLMDPPPVLTAGAYRLPPEGIQLAAADTIATDAEQLAQATARPRTVSAKAVEDFTNAVAQGRDFSAAVEDLAAAQIRQATARGVPLEVARKAAAAFANELALNLGNRMGVEAAIADAERGFAGAIRALSVADKADPLLQALTTGQGLDSALSDAGLSGRRGTEALGNALNSGEQQGSAIGKGQNADQAHAKAAKSGNALMDALAGGEGLDQFAALLGDPHAAQRFAELLQQGMSPEQALSAAKQAADAAGKAQGAAEAASKGEVEALASGKGGDSQLAQALKQTGIDTGMPTPSPAGGRGGTSVMEALASGQGVTQVLGGGGQSFDQAFGNALAEGGSIEQAQGAAAKASSASGKVAADSTLGQIASGNAGTVSGSTAFEAAVGEALQRGTATGTAIGEATTRAALAQQASAKVEAAAQLASNPGNPFAPSPSPFQTSPTVAPTTSTTTLGAPTPTNNAPASFVTQVAQSVQTTTAQAIAATLSALQTQVAQNVATASLPPPPPPPPTTVSRDDTPPKPNLPPTISVAPTANVAEDGTVTLTYTANDSDGSIAAITVTVANSVLLPTSSVVLDQANSTITLSPAANKYGTSTLSIRVTDNAGASASASTQVTVTPVGDTATVESKTTSEDTAITLTLTRSALDSAEGSEVAHFRITGITGGTLANASGTAIVEGGYVQIGTDGTAQVTFTPNANLNSLDGNSFRFDVQGATDTLGGGLSPVTARSTITVTAVNDTPTAADKSIDVARTTHVFSAADFGFADVDSALAGNNTLQSVTITGFSGNGALMKGLSAAVVGSTIAVNDLGSLQYVPASGQKGDDGATLTFTVFDGLASSTPHTLTLGEAPLALYAYTQGGGFKSRTSSTQIFELNENSAITSASFAFKGVHGPVQTATLKVTAYNVNYALGERDKISFNNVEIGKLQGGLFQTSTTSFSLGTATLSSATNSVKVDVFSFDGSSLFGDNYLGHQANLDRAELTVTYKPLTGAKVTAFDLMGSTVNGGNVTVDSRAIVGITTAGDYRLEFRVIDSSGTLLQSKSVDILGATANSQHVVTGSPYFANSTAGGNFEVQASLVQLSGGSVVASQGQTIAYRTFTHVQNGNSGQDIAAGAIGTIASNAAIGSTIALLGHSDTNTNQSVTYALVNPGSQFTLGTNSDGLTELRVGGTLSTGSHTIRIRATDASGLSVEKDLTVTVGGANTAPVFADATTTAGAINEDSSAIFTVAANDTDTLTYTASALSGTAIVTAGGQVTYTPDADYNGSDTITVTASDGFAGGTISREVAVTVNTVNDRPVLGGGTTWASETKVSDLLTGLASDVDGDGVGIAAWDTGSAGTWQYKLASGDAWSDVSATSASQARLLGPDAYLRFVAGSNGGAASLNIRGWDGTAGGTNGDLGDTGATSAFGTTTHAITVNSAPVVGHGTVSVSGGASAVPADTDNYQGYPAAAKVADGSYAIAWYSTTSQGTDTDAGSIRLRLFNADGTAKAATEIEVNQAVANSQTNPDIAALTSGGFVVTYATNATDSGNIQIYGQRFTVDGSLSGSPFMVNTLDAGTQSLAKVTALSTGGFAVAWETNDPASGDTSGSAIAVQRFDASGTKVSGETRVNSATTDSQTSPDIIGLSSGKYAVLWTSGTDVYGKIYNADGTVLKNDFIVNTTTAGQQAAADAAVLVDGSFVVAYTSAGFINGTGSDIVLQRFDADGNKVGSEFAANVNAGNERYSPGIAALPDGGYVVTWGYSAGTPYYARSFDADGTARGSFVTVASPTNTTSAPPAAPIALANGDVVVAYMDGFAGTSAELYQQRLTSAASSRALTAMAEDAAAGSGTQVSTLIANVADADSGALKGIAITAIGNGTGWEYSTDNGSTWSNVGTVSSASALHLSSSDWFRFNTPANWNGTASFTWQAWDQSNTVAKGSKAAIAASGGATAYSADSATVSQVVTAVNDAPTSSNTHLTVTEDLPRLFAATDFAFSDVDGNTLAKVRFVGLGSGSGTLQQDLDQNGSWSTLAANTEVAVADLGKTRYVPSANVNGTGQATISYHVSDGTEWSTSANSLIVDITAINDAPVIPATETALAFTTTGVDGTINLGQYVQGDLGTDTLSSSYIRIEMDVYLLADGQQHNLARVGQNGATQGELVPRYVPTIQSDGDVALWTKDTGDLVATHPSTGAHGTASAGAWHTLKYTYDGTSATASINNTAYDLGTPSTLANGAHNYLWVGSDQDGKFASKAVIDNVKIYSASDTLLANWQFSEGSGTSVADASGNGHTGTLGSGSFQPSFVTVYNNTPFTVENDTTKTFQLPGSDPDGDTLAFALFGSNGGATHGTASISDGILTYSAGSSAGQDHISYTITDTSGSSVTGTVHLGVV